MGVVEIFWGAEIYNQVVDCDSNLDGVGVWSECEKGEIGACATSCRRLKALRSDFMVGVGVVWETKT